MYGYSTSMFLINSFIFETASATDPDADAFISATGITDATQKSAINTLVVDLKGYSLWSKMDAIYPFVGGTSTTHKYNLKNPLDTDVAFRLVFNGGWTHSSTGALPNGTNAYANTFLVPNTTLSLNSAHISFYSRTDVASGLDIGAGGISVAGSIYMLQKYTDSKNYTKIHNGTGIFIETPGWTRGDGFFCVRRNDALDFINSRNSVSVTSSAQPLSASVSKTTYPIWIGALNNSGAGGFYSARETAFASIGDGVSDVELSNYYTAVQDFQTTLSRNV